MKCVLNEALCDVAQSRPMMDIESITGNNNWMVIDGKMYYTVWTATN